MNTFTQNNVNTRSYHMAVTGRHHFLPYISLNLLVTCMLLHIEKILKCWGEMWLMQLWTCCWRSQKGGPRCKFWCIPLSQRTCLGEFWSPKFKSPKQRKPNKMQPAWNSNFSGIHLFKKCSTTCDIKMQAGARIPGKYLVRQCLFLLGIDEMWIMSDAHGNNKVIGLADKRRMRQCLPIGTSFFAVFQMYKRAYQSHLICLLLFKVNAVSRLSTQVVPGT